MNSLKCLKAIDRQFILHRMTIYVIAAIFISPIHCFSRDLGPACYSLFRPTPLPSPFNISEGNYENKNDFIKSLFLRWAKPKGLKIDSLGAVDSFLSEANKKILSLTNALKIYLAQRALRQTNIKEINFKDRTFKVIEKLGGETEGNSFLIGHEGKRAVIKKYYAESNFQKHIQIFRLLEAKGISISKILDIDYKTNSILFEYREGLTINDLYLFLRENGYPEEYIDLFFLSHGLFQNSVMLSAGNEISKMLNDSLFFRPHPNNTLFDPKTSQWVIIDVH